MDYVSVASSSIANVGYEQSSEVLAVRFHNGAEYHYRGVPKRLFDDFLAAASVGQFYHESVRNAGFRYEKVGETS